MGKRLHGDPEAAGDAQLGQGHGEPAFADVVAGPDEAGVYRGVEAAVPMRSVRIGLRGRADGVVVRDTGDEVEVAAGELRPRHR